jgi:hypothetical protein
MPGTAPDIRKDRVVRLRIAAEPLLDAAELRRKDLLPRQHQGLQSTRHATVAVPERVDHDEIEVGHGRDGGG